MRKFSKQWLLEFIKVSTVRAVWTFCQTLTSMVAMDNLDLLKVDWKTILLTSLISAMLSYAKSFIVSVPEMELMNYKVKEIK